VNERLGLKTTSIVDRGTQEIAAIAQLRSDAMSHRVLSEVLVSIRALLTPAHAQALKAAFPDVAAIQLALKSAMARILGASFVAPSHDRGTTPGTAATQLSDETEVSEEQSEEFEQLPQRLGAVRLTLLERLGGLASKIGQWTRRVCAGALRVIRSLRDALPRKDKPEGFHSFPLPAAAPGAPASGSGGHTQRSASAPRSWTERFGEDPQDEVKKALLTVSKALEEIAVARRREKEEAMIAECTEQAAKQRKMNILRDALAKLLIPLSDGTVPLHLLSRHFVGPWVTHEDLRNAVVRALQQRHNH
jgi:hypothetical protein